MRYEVVRLREISAQLSGKKAILAIPFSDLRQILDNAADRIDTDARRIAELEGEVERLRNLLSQTYPYIGWGPAPDGLADKVWEETKHIKEATDD